jgi:hypothetical protein
MELTELKAQIDTLKSELNNVKVELRSLEVALTSSIENRYVQVECLHRVYSLVPGLGPLPPTRGWAASPDFLLKIAETIFEVKPNFVLELGSGVTTFVVNACCNSFGHCTGLSIDHDHEYLSQTEEQFRSTKINNLIELKHCPLKDVEIELVNWLWYDLPLASFTTEIEVLIVDGPPRRIQKNSRYPAIMQLHTRFANKTKILLDDYNRADEQEVVSVWMKDLDRLGFHVELKEFKEYEKGLAILEVTRSS